jgi:hypothetical protein
MRQLMRSFWIGLVVGGLGLVGGLVIAHETQPQCPQEDSCVVDYHDGAWHIREVAP